MRIQFIKESDTSISAIAQDVVWKGALHNELYWGDIDLQGETWLVRWNDDYNKPISFPTLLDAKKHIESNYKTREPHVNGSKYYLS